MNANGTQNRSLFSREEEESGKKRQDLKKEVEGDQDDRCALWRSQTTERRREKNRQTDQQTEMRTDMPTDQQTEMRTDQTNRQ